MKKIILGIGILGLLGNSLSALTIKEYTSTFQIATKYKQEIADIEIENGGCNIQKNNPNVFKYFEDILSFNNDSILNNYVSSLSQSSAKIDEENFSIDSILTLENDLSCLIKEGAIIASSLSDSKSSIFTKQKSNFNFNEDFKSNKNIYISKNILKIMKSALSDLNLKNCRLNGSLEKISCSNGKFLFDIQSNTLTYKGTLLYSQNEYYGYSLNTTQKFLKSE